MKKVAAVLSVTLLLGQMAAIAEAKEATNKNAVTINKPQPTYTLDQLKPVKVSAKSNVKLTDVNILTTDEGDVLTYTLTFYNNDAKDISLIDYWSRVKSKSGTVYSSNLLAKDKEKKRVSPQSQVSVTYFSKIGKNTKLNDLIFEVVKWDFSKPNYEDKLGTFQIPNTFTTATQFNKIKNMNINDVWGKVTVNQFFMYQSDDYYYATVALQIENAGYKVIDDPKYKFMIRTSDGASYPLQADATSVDYKIQPHDKKTLNLMTMIPKNVKTDNLQLQIIQEDGGGEKAPSSNLAVATFQLPNNSMEEMVTGSYEAKDITVGNSKVSTKITNTRISQGTDEYQVSLNFNFNNTSSQTVKLPNYEFVVLGTDGYKFPITTKVLEGTTLKPLEEKDIRLSVSIPKSAGIQDLKLSLNQPTDPNQKEEKLDFPVAIYDIPAVNPTTNSQGIKYNITNEKGNFTIKLSSIQRLPWVDGDIVAANMTIQNEGVKAIELPKMEGVFKIDGALASGDNKLVQSNSSMVVGPKSSLDLYMVAKVPNGLDFKELQIDLMEKIGETSAELIQFINTGKLKEIPEVEFGTTYDINTAGRQAQIKARESIIYPGSGTNIIYTDLEMESLESRQANLSQLVGYYATEDGQYYQANAIQVDHATSPGGKNIVTLWAKVPKNINTTNMKLIVGEGITEDKMTPPKGESSAYVNASALNLKFSTNQYKQVFQEIEMFPYTISITNMKGTLAGSSVTIGITYNLRRDLSYEMGEYGHKLVFEFIDARGVSHEKELSFDGDLEEGNSRTVTVSFSGSSMDDMNAGVYHVNIHDKFQGLKRKLANNGVNLTNEF